MRASPKGWLGLAAYVIVWDACCPPGETLSHGSARAMARNSWLTGAAVLYLAAHLMDVLPDRFDLLHQGGKLFGHS